MLDFKFVQKHIWFFYEDISWPGLRNPVPPGTWHLVWLRNSLVQNHVYTRRHFRCNMLVVGNQNMGQHRVMYPDVFDMLIDKCRLVVTQIKGKPNRFRIGFLIPDCGIQLIPWKMVPPFFIIKGNLRVPSCELPEQFKHFQLKYLIFIHFEFERFVSLSMNYNKI